MDKATRATCPALSVSPVGERLSELALTLALDEKRNCRYTALSVSLSALPALTSHRRPKQASAASRRRARHERERRSPRGGGCPARCAQQVARVGDVRSGFLRSEMRLDPDDLESGSI
jgi:hypothetical protein